MVLEIKAPGLTFFKIYFLWFKVFSIGFSFILHGSTGHLRTVILPATDTSFDIFLVFNKKDPQYKSFKFE